MYFFVIVIYCDVSLVKEEDPTRTELIFAPAHDKKYNKTCATSDQHAHPSDQSLLIAYVFYSLQAFQRGINENSRYTRWMNRLI